MELVSLKAVFVIGQFLNRNVIRSTFHCQALRVTGRTWTDVPFWYTLLCDNVRVGLANVDDVQGTFLEHPLVHEY